MTSGMTKAATVTLHIRNI